jgi:integrase
VIDTYAPSTQGNQYAVLVAALSPHAKKAAYKKAFEHWRSKMVDYKAAKDGEPAHAKTEKEGEAWLSWDEVEERKDSLKKDVAAFATAKHITAHQFDTLLQYVVLSLYSDLPPRRNQDFLDMYVVKKWSEDMPADRNYYDMATHQFIFNKYKTAKTYGQQTVEVPNTEEAPLQRTLATLIKFHPLGKQKEFKLLVKADGSNLNTVNAITRLLNRIFGKKIGSSMLRHLFLSSKYGEVNKEMEADAAAMGHSTSEQKDYIKYD